MERGSEVSGKESESESMVGLSLDVKKSNILSVGWAAMVFAVLLGVI